MSKYREVGREGGECEERGARSEQREGGKTASRHTHTPRLALGGNDSVLGGGVAGRVSRREKKSATDLSLSSVCFLIPLSVFVAIHIPFQLQTSVANKPLPENNTVHTLSCTQHPPPNLPIAPFQLTFTLYLPFHLPFAPNLPIFNLFTSILPSRCFEPNFFAMLLELRGRPPAPSQLAQPKPRCLPRPPVDRS